MPVKISTLQGFKTFHSYNNKIVCMVPPSGNLSSKTDNNFQPLSEGCEVNSEKVTSDNDNTVETTSVTFTKKIKRDKKGNIIKETDTSAPRFQVAKENFFNKSSS